MLSFIGDYTCKLDSKGRAVVPVVFRKEMQAAGEVSFVMRRNIFDECIDVYPKDEWLKLIAGLREKLSQFNREQVRFFREFFRGAQEVELDGNGRVLIPRKMLDSIGIESVSYTHLRLVGESVIYRRLWMGCVIWRHYLIWWYTQI